MENHHNHSNNVNNLIVTNMSTNQNNQSNHQDSYFDSLPVGYRFMPTDEELIIIYLRKKIANEPLPLNRIKEVEFYEKHPQIFAEEHPLHREKERYFFTSRDRKYSRGERPGRTVKDVGFWKATGTEKVLKLGDEIIGNRKMLVFYEGVAKSSTKTNWVMIEYVAHSDEKRQPKDNNDMKLDDWVIVKLYENRKQKDPEPGLHRKRDRNNGEIIITEATSFDDNQQPCVEAILSNPNEFSGLNVGDLTSTSGADLRTSIYSNHHEMLCSPHRIEMIECQNSDFQDGQMFYDPQEDPRSHDHGFGGEAGFGSSLNDDQRLYRPGTGIDLVIYQLLNS